VSIRTEVLMGTSVTIEVLHAAADAAIERALAWFREVEAACTRFDERSELMRLTAHVGAAVPVSDLLFEAVRFALRVAQESGGAFDPTIGGELHRRGFTREHRTGAVVRSPVAPAPGVSYRDVDVDAGAHTITLQRPLLLDLGAVAKGLAVDLAARELQPFADFAIDAGGDLYLGGHNAEGQSWSVGIRDPRTPGAVIESVRVSNAAVCTSGDYERAAPAGAGHHLIDPRTSLSPTETISVTVMAPSAMLADALATAAFVLGPHEGLALLERLEVDGLVVARDLTTRRTGGWPRA
jgi:thiamine biosynthesis lipoprotein